MNHTQVINVVIKEAFGKKVDEVERDIEERKAEVINKPEWLSWRDLSIAVALTEIRLESRWN